MQTLAAQAFAKINLCLDIVGKRDDGYHLISSVMQSVSLCDDVSIYFESLDPSSAPTMIQLTCDDMSLPTNEANTAYKAAQLFLEATGLGTEKLYIHVKKRIPAQSGMGGASADAAAVLRLLNDATDAMLSERDLIRLAEKVGADVPFCMLGGTCLCEGIGEDVTPISSLAGLPLVMIKPPFSISTAKAYASFDSDKKLQTRTREQKEKKIMFKDNSESLKPLARMQAYGQHLNNDLERIAERSHPLIAKLRMTLAQKGAAYARMTGSGSAVFGVFPSEKVRDDALFFLRSHLDSECQLFSCETIQPPINERTS